MQNCISGLEQKEVVDLIMKIGYNNLKDFYLPYVEYKTC